MIERGYVVGVDEDYRRAVPRAARAGGEGPAEADANGPASRDGTGGGAGRHGGADRSGGAGAADGDLRFVELLVGGAHPRERLQEEAGAVAALVEAHGLGLVVELPVGPDLASPHDAVREAARRVHEAAVEAARAAGAGAVLLRARTDPARPGGTDAARRRLLASVRDLESYADHCGVELRVANAADDRFPVPWFDRLFSATDVGMALDVPRALQAGLAPAEVAAFLRTYGDRVPQVRLVERPGRRLPAAAHGRERRGDSAPGGGAPGRHGAESGPPATGRAGGGRSGAGEGEGIDPRTLADTAGWRGAVSVRSRSDCPPTARDGDADDDADREAGTGASPPRPDADRVDAGPSGE